MCMRHLVKLPDMFKSHMRILTLTYLRSTQLYIVVVLCLPSHDRCKCILAATLHVRITDAGHAWGPYGP
jgi:hypothetical protein